MVVVVVVSVGGCCFCCSLYALATASFLISKFIACSMFDGRIREVARRLILVALRVSIFARAASAAAFMLSFGSAFSRALRALVSDRFMAMLSVGVAASALLLREVWNRFSAVLVAMRLRVARLRAATVGLTSEALLATMASTASSSSSFSALAVVAISSSSSISSGPAARVTIDWALSIWMSRVIRRMISGLWTGSVCFLERAASAMVFFRASVAATTSSSSSSFSSSSSSSVSSSSSSSGFSAL
mmetsp:Transcript_16613/g.38376  ORF Transcript_16613/g.38376 Transcript_16613/m.38376 type:complete len:246 (+) Transcript_16613:214-951(+)